MAETIETIIEFLPVMTSYIAYGTVFLTIYRFITFKDKKQDFIEYFFKCSALSFIIITICESLLSLFKLNRFSGSWGFYLFVLVVTILSAFATARISTSKWFNKLLLKIGIERTTNSTIWKDVVEANTKVAIYLKNKDLAYVGYHKYTEDNRDYPKMVLSHYKLINTLTTKVLVDYSDDDDRVIMIDTAEVDKIEFIYKDR